MKNNLLHGAPLYYPSAKEWMWTYCIYLGPFTDSKGGNHDLGIYIDDYHDEDSILRYSNATVYGDEPGNYQSGDLYTFSTVNETAAEVVRRAKVLKLIPESFKPVVRPYNTSNIMQKFIEDEIAEMCDYDEDDYPGL